MNAILTISQLSRSLVSSPLPPYALGALSGITMGTGHALLLCLCNADLSNDSSEAYMFFIGNALIGAIPELFRDNYLGALVSIPCSFFALLSTRALAAEMEDSEHSHLITPLLVGALFIMGSIKFLLGCSLAHILLITTIVKLGIDFLLLINRYTSG